MKCAAVSRVFGLCVLFVIMGTARGRAASSSDSEKPNILIVIADDVTHTDLACYGGTNVKTPNIDRLAQQGVKFNYAYLAMSMCAPCRQELYSGLYPMRSGAAWNHSRSKPGTKSICHYLRDLGYRVGLAGKKHIAPQASYPFVDVPGFERGCCSLTAKADHKGIRRFMRRKPEQPFCLVVALVVAHSTWTSSTCRPRSPTRPRCGRIMLPRIRLRDAQQRTRGPALSDPHDP